MFTIANQELTVTISAQGAELQSIYNKTTQLEYLWDANPRFWPKKSPVLFPIVGGLKDSVYSFDGQQYPLGRHGFARESVFTVVAQTASSIVFQLDANESTRAVYPFEFSFSIAYRVVDNKLYVTYLVQNTGEKDLYFSVGAHPAFKVPLTDGTNYEDWYLEFGTTETVGIHPLDSAGLVEPIAVPYLNNCSQLPLKKSLFYGDALVFKNLASHSIGIKSEKTEHGLTLHYGDFPFMGIWSAKDADFVCIEPWCGVADSTTTDGQISNKEGINQLAAGGTFEREWYVALF